MTLTEQNEQIRKNTAQRNSHRQNEGEFFLSSNGNFESFALRFQTYVGLVSQLTSMKFSRLHSNGVLKLHKVGMIGIL